MTAYLVISVNGNKVREHAIYGTLDEAREHRAMLCGEGLAAHIRVVEVEHNFA